MTRLFLFLILCFVAAAATCSFEKKKEDQNIHIIHVKSNQSPSKQMDDPEILELYLPPEILTRQRRESRTEATTLQCKDKDCQQKKCGTKLNENCPTDNKNHNQNNGKRILSEPLQVTTASVKS
ncbi:uncharacterized protein LOC100679797 [Nasonia vitripennis]|uniref:Uncharacterized protein n=1 Tax=Nasonia vitripennis TaxID=7425 RepID=A0A7M7GEZ0_NASVI|nr:uncharacterized protein LOC100679797 [Nasonia vitripennis]